MEVILRKLIAEALGLEECDTPFKHLENSICMRAREQKLMN